MAHGELNHRQAAFCREYLVDFNGAAAYLRAGYEPKAAFAQNSGAYRLLAMPKIKAELARLAAEALARNKISVDDVLEETRRVAFANVSDVVVIEQGRVRIKDTAELAPDTLSALATVQETKDGQLTVKMHDKIRALEFLARYLGLFTEQVALIHDGPPPIIQLVAVDTPQTPVIETDAEVIEPDEAADPAD